MKKIILLFLLLHTLISVSAQPAFLIHFSKDSYTLNAEAKNQLTTLSNILSTDHTCSISVTGRADSDGDSLENILLAGNRIDAVLSFFNFSDFSGLNRIILGENNPLVPNTNEFNKKENRSVLIELKNCNEDFNTPSGTIRIIDQLYGPTTSVFEFESKENITLKSYNGTFIKIPEFAFCDKYGRVINGKVTLKIREFLSYPEMFVSGITMNSDDQILQSAGFLNLEASNNDKELQLRYGKNIQVVIKNEDADSSMKYFVGNTDESGNINWQLSKNTNNNIKARTLGINCSLLYEENLTKKQKDSVDYYIYLLKLRENEDLTAKLISNAFSKRDEVKFNRLIKLLHLENIWFGMYDSLIDTKPVANVYLYKSSTQREVLFSDEVFEEIDFSSVNVIGFEINGWRSSDYMFDSFSTSEIISVGQYLVSTNRMSLINVDRFFNINNPARLDVNIKDIKPSTVVRLVFKNSRSVIAGNNAGDGIVFPILPSDEPVYLFAYSVYNGELYFAIKPVLTGKDVKESLVMTKGSFSEFREIYQKLN